MNGGNQSWQQVFTYFDQNGQNGQYGNRRIDTPNTTPGLITENPLFDPATNRIQPQAGEQYAYDPAGNLTRNQTGHTFAYDAENRQTIYDGGNPLTSGASYLYDGDGRRVKKLSSGGTTVFIYNAMGLLVAEYSDAQPTGSGTSYLTADNLGTPRVITNSNSGVIGRHDYLPFGEEIATSYGGRSGVSGYAATDDIKQKFTLKERDIETGLDYFLARYYSATQGRFTSVDPENAGADPSDPQSWNGYAYARNNPQVYTDSDGRTYTVCDRNGKNCVDYKDSEFDKLRKGGPVDGYTFKNGKIYYQGELTATYSNDCLYCGDLINGIGSRSSAIEKGVLAFAIVGSVGGATGGVGLYYLTPYLAPTVTTLGLSSATGTGAAVTEGSLTGLSIQQLNSIVRPQLQLIRQLFKGQATGAEGARQALANLKIPAGLSRETLLAYAEIARRYVEAGRDATGVQAVRLKIIEEALKQIK